MPDGIEVTHEPEIPVHLVQLHLCKLCIDGVGGQCHVPGCALWIKAAPDVSIRDLVTVIEPGTADADAIAAGAQEALRWQWGDRIAMAVASRDQNPANAVNAVFTEMSEAIVKAAAPHLKATTDVAALTERAEKAEAERDKAYRERAHLVAFLAACYGAEIVPAESDSGAWFLIFVTTPAGQMSWHLHEDDLDLFEWLLNAPETGIEWDGHTTEQKYGRLADMTDRIARGGGFAGVIAATATARPAPLADGSLGDLKSVTERAEKAERACRTLGRVVDSMARSLRAAWIEIRQGDLNGAAQWVLESVPDVDDSPPEQQWNGTETSQEWFDRTRPEPGTYAMQSGVAGAPNSMQGAATGPGRQARQLDAALRGLAQIRERVQDMAERDWADVGRIVDDVIAEVNEIADGKWMAGQPAARPAPVTEPEASRESREGITGMFWDNLGNSEH